jgi:hypothetical protein
MVASQEAGSPFTLKLVEDAVYCELSPGEEGQKVCFWLAERFTLRDVRPTLAGTGLG